MEAEFKKLRVERHREGSRASVFGYHRELARPGVLQDYARPVAQIARREYVECLHGTFLNVCLQNVAQSLPTVKRMGRKCGPFGILTPGF
jgi:hypothetical protein